MFFSNKFLKLIALITVTTVPLFTSTTSIVSASSNSSSTLHATEIPDFRTTITAGGGASKLVYAKGSKTLHWYLYPVHTLTPYQLHGTIKFTNGTGKIVKTVHLTGAHIGKLSNVIEHAPQSKYGMTAIMTGYLAYATGHISNILDPTAYWK